MLTRRYNSLDILKVIMAVCVIAIHTQPLYGYNNEIITRLYDSIVGIANPIFFLSTGFLLGKEYLGGGYKETILISRAKILLQMYILWTILYLPLTIYRYLNNDYGVIRDILDFFRGLFFVGEHYNSYALWYLLSCVYGLIFIIVLSRRRLPFEKIVVCCNLLMVLGFVFTELVIIKESLPYIIGIPVKILWAILGPRGRIFMGAGYISLGMLIAKKESKSKIIPLVFISVCGFYATFMGEGLIKSIGFVLLSCGVFSLAIKVQLKNAWQYEIFRNCSVVMYYVHLYVWTLFYVYKYGEKTYGLDAFIATAVISVALGLGYSFYLSCKMKKCREHKISAECEDSE